MNNLRAYLSRISIRTPSFGSAPPADAGTAADSSAVQTSLDAPAGIGLRSQKHDNRLADFEACLRRPVIPLQLCRKLCFGGIPDGTGLRSVCWKILLGYLPTDRTLWPEVLEKRRTEYEKLTVSIFINPFQSQQPHPTQLREFEVNPSPESDAKVDVIDNPLLIPGAKSKDTLWGKFFDNNHLRDEIAKDVQRTHSAMHFFTQKLDYADLYSKSDKKVQFLESIKVASETHHDVMARILFIFAKLNPGVRYVQGMNELLAPIYYVFAQDPDDSVRLYAEADAFFCFTGMMADLKDRFIASLDCSDLGISSSIEDLRDMLRKADPELYLHLEKQFVDARYYSLRWITLLCSQEFRLPDILRLWDSLFADPCRFEFLQYCCCSMLICIRSKLLSLDYAGILQTLQSYPETDIKDILNGANDVMRQITGRQLEFTSPETEDIN